jgi:hypothetical protein
MADQLTSNGKARATPGWGGPRAVAGSVAPAEHRPVPQGARELDGFLAVICAFLIRTNRERRNFVRHSSARF